MVPQNATSEAEIKQYPIEKMGKSESSEQEYYELHNGSIRVYEKQHNIYNRFRDTFFSSETMALKAVKDNCVHLASDELRKIRDAYLQIKSFEKKASALLSIAYHTGSDKLVYPMYANGYVCGTLTVQDIIDKCKDENRKIPKAVLVHLLSDLCNEETLVYDEYK